MMTDLKKEKTIISWVSAIILIAVGGLLGMRTYKLPLGVWTAELPHVYGHINLLVSVLLVVAVMLVKKGKIQTHKKVMSLNMILGATFLLMYVVYHVSNPNKPYTGAYQWLYMPILLSHIVLAAAVLPIVLRAYLYGSKGFVTEHRKLVRFAFPIWFYVSLSGYIVYMMLHYPA
jgi:putative membrane protein